MVAIGRSFNTDDINVDAVKLEINKNGSIKVNNKMETSVKNIYAIGDCAGVYLLAYTASYEGQIAVANALGKNKQVDYNAVPITVFTDPEVGSIGISQQKAESEGRDIRIGQFQFRVLGKSKAEREIAGGVKIIADKKTDKILGAHIVGAHATDLIHEVAVAMSQKMTAEQLGDVFHAHPVLAEAVMEAAHDVHGLSVHTPKKTK